jgi:alpha-tubulin suppressor-like RCC1 family protein
MRRFAIASVVTLVGVIGCLGDDPASSSPSSSSSGAEGGTALGAPCNATTPCSGGGVCVDGVCCENACSGVCEACNGEGRCLPVSGAPKHGACNGEATGPCSGTCDGTDRSACKYPEVACGPAPSCAGGTVTPASHCKAGSCEALPTQKCSLGCFQEGCLGVKQVAAGSLHACALLTDGKVRCWGSNTSGQAGQDPATDPVKSPVEVAGLSDVKAIAAASSATCALMADGTVSCWGYNGGGQLGRGAGTDTTPHYKSAPVTGISGATFLSTGVGAHFCAIVAGGEIRCWGGNDYGQLGNGTTASPGSTTPVVVCQPPASSSSCTPSAGATFVTAGDRHTCAIFAGDKVACWGRGTSGELGRATSANDKYPDFVAPSLAAKYLSAGKQQTCAVDATGAVECWGTNDEGSLGNGSSTGTVVAPTPVCTKDDCTTHLAGSTAVTTFAASSCAISSGAVKCWGTNTGGQLGDGSATSSQTVAATSAILTGAEYVASGGAVHFAVVTEGANRDLRCWGNETSYECGVGKATVPRKTPVSPAW